MFGELKVKAENNSLEVEDLIKFAADDNKDAISFLKQAIDEYSWDDYLAAKSSNRVPLATWADIIIAYLEDGYSGLKKYVSSDSGEYLETARFVIGILDSIKRQETIKGIIEFFDKLILSPEIDYDLSKKLAGAINALLSFPPFIEIDDEDKTVLCNFINKFLTMYGDKESDRSTAFCALRGVGNLGSIDVIKSYPKLTGSYKGIENIVIKAIKARN